MRAKPIVVGVDGSPASVRAAQLAYRLAEAAGTTCHVVHAVREPGLAKVLRSGRAPQSELRFRARRDIQIALREIIPAAVLHRVEVGIGRAGVVLAEVVARRGAQLVVLGGKRRGAVAQRVAGSTAHYLVRKLDVPVLVTGPSSRRVRRVLAAVDLSFASAPTLKAAARIAELAGARLRAVHVLEPIRYARPGPRLPDRRPALHASRFAALVSGLTGSLQADTVTYRGPAPQSITAAASKWKADLVVVGSHGKGWADRLLIGSTTEQLLDLLPTAILVVPVSPPRQKAATR